MPKNKKKKTRRPKSQDIDESLHDRAMKELWNMKHKDLVKASILRGIDFEEMINFTHPKLVSWFVKHYDNTCDEKNLVLYDQWRESRLTKDGYNKKDHSYFFHPDLKFGYSGKLDKVDKIRDVKPESKVPDQGKKPAAKMNEVTGVREGTKKDLTYNLTYAKVEQSEIIKRVMEKFPGAQEKSIKIWHKRALKKMKEEKNGKKD